MAVKGSNRDFSGNHAHRIELEDLILYRRKDRGILLKKADKIARDLIALEMRRGETFHSPRRGVYILALPRLTPEAGALRCSVIADKIHRQIRQFNPVLKYDNHEGAGQEKARPLPKVAVGSGKAHRMRSKIYSPRSVTRNATMAVERMIETSRHSTHQDVPISTADRARIDKLDAVFVPVWHVRRNVITGYRCQWSDGNRIVEGEEFIDSLDPASIEVQYAKLDISLYSRAMRSTQMLLQRGLKAIVIVPVHFSTVDNTRLLHTFLAAGTGLPESARSLIALELVNFMPGISRFRLRDGIGYLRGCARALIAEAGGDFADLAMFSGWNFHSISLNCKHFNQNEKQALHVFHNFAAHSFRHRLQTYVHGLTTPSLAVSAIEAGIAYIDGPVISDPLDQADAAHLFKLEQLYLRPNHAHG